MGKPIAGQNKLPFSIEGIKVNGAVLSDGTKLSNLRIFKQRSSREFDLINPLTSEVYQKLKITGNGLDTEAVDADLIDLLSPGTFFIRAIVDDETVGFVSKFYNNLVHLIKGGTVFVPDYEVFYSDSISPVQVIESTIPSTLSSQFTKPGVTPAQLISPTPNLATNMIISTDGYIELALAVRLNTGTTAHPSLIIPVDGVYTSAFESTQDWTVPYVVGLRTTEDVLITDLYDIRLTFFGNNTGIEDSHMIFVDLVESNGSYVWHNAATGDITDSWIDDDKKTIQNIQRYSFYSQYFVFPAVPAGTKPVGKFKIKLEATHKTTKIVTTCVTYAQVSNA